MSRSVVYHVGFEGDVAYAYEDVITENINAFSGHTIEERNLSLLTQVIKSVVEPFISQQNDYYDFTIEEDDGDGSENIDQIAIAAANGAQDTGMRARKRQINLTDSITTASNHNDSTVASETEGGSEEESDDEAEDQDRVDEWMEQVMAKSEQDYLQEESDYSDVAPDEPVLERAHIYQSPARAEKEQSSSEPSSDSDGDSEAENHTAKVHASADKSVDRPLYHLTSSDDDTLHSERSIERQKKAKQTKDHAFQSPAPYQIRKSAAAIYDTAEAEEKEPLPAWLMPKSPLDAHFRKAYGGLGKDDLQETIELITSTQKKALRASRIADDNEVSSAASGEHSEDESHTDAGEIDEPVPAWLMPKSPLDAHFRKGYGGLGKEDLQDAIEEITTAQKKAQAHIRTSQRVPDEFDLVNAITVEDLPDNFGVPSDAVGTPTNVRPARRLSGSEGNSGSGGSKAKGREYAKQQKLFQSPKPSRIPVAVSSAKKSAAKVAPSEEPLPAWLMPKSPLDAHFRKGYGGLGHEDLDEAIAEITSSQKKAQRSAGVGRDDTARRSISKMLENYYDAQHSTKKTSTTPTPSKGKKKASKKHATDTTTGETSDAIMFDVESGLEEEKYSQIDLPTEQDATHLLPSAHPSTSPPSKLTNNASLNAMMRQSFQSYVSQYAKNTAAPGPHGNKVEIKSGKNSRSSTPQSTKKKNTTTTASPASAAVHSGTKAKAPLSNEDFSAYLRSPELKHNFDEIDALIRESQKNLRRMKLDEKNATVGNGKRIQKTRSGSIVSNVSLTDHESQEPRPRGRKVPRAKLTKRADAPTNKPLERRASTDSATAKLAAKANAKAQRLSTAKLHEQSTGNVRQAAAAPSGMASVSTAPVSWSRRSSTTTMASKISQTLLNEGPARLPSPSPRLVRSPSPALHAQQRARSQTKPRARSAPVVQPAQRLLRVDSRLLVPTTAALIRSADIATNSSKAANLHNEWHTMLRSGDSDVELSGRKLRNKILRRSLPAVNAEQIIEWNSPGTNEVF